MICRKPSDDCTAHTVCGKYSNAFTIRLLYPRCHRPQEIIRSHENFMTLSTWMRHLQSSKVPEHFVRGGVLTYTVFILHDLFEQAASRSKAGSLMQEVHVKQWLSGTTGHCRIICKHTSHINPSEHSGHLTLLTLQKLCILHTVYLCFVLFSQ